ncbi:MAG: dTDP-4-dehydrorhamnose reductase, partial [Pseudomonadota bacterium]|nr:dTDP-4-dehydrorhamnose reductase [Pseudomonadota bacterium]
VDEIPAWGHLEPVNTTLICTKIRNTFGIKQMPWRSGLVDELVMLKQNNGREVASDPAR